MKTKKPKGHVVVQTVDDYDFQKNGELIDFVELAVIASFVSSCRTGAGARGQFPKSQLSPA